MKLYLSVIPIMAIYLMTEPVDCNKPCKATISVAAQRTQVSTQFTITGKNFEPGKTIKISISNRPAPLSPDPWSCGAVAISDGAGNFTTVCDVGYLAGNDDGNRSPYIVASDGGCAGVQAVSSGYWFAH